MITDLDKQYQNSDAFVLWENKAWSDRIVCLEWSTTYLNQISEHNHIKCDGSKENVLLLQDNIYGQVQKKYPDICRSKLILFFGIYLMITQTNWIILV